MSSDGKKSDPRAAPYYLDSHPSEVSLIECHLRPWVPGTAGREHAFIHEADLYAAGPAELSRKFAPAISHDGERVWYFLTRLRRKSPNGRGSRFARTVDTGAGWWHGEAKEKAVVDALTGGRQVGLRQLFSFMTFGRGGARVRTGWIMSELSLYDGSGARRDEEDYLRVLCKVYRSPRHRGDELGNTEPASAKGEVTTAATAAEESSVTITDAPASLGKAKKDECDAEASAAGRERKRKAADDAESSAAARKRRMADDDNKSHTSEIHCPQCGCGFHIEAAQIDPVEGGETGDSAQRNLKLHNFF